MKTFLYLKHYCKILNSLTKMFKKSAFPKVPKIERRKRALNFIWQSIIHVYVGKQTAKSHDNTASV